MTKVSLLTTQSITKYRDLIHETNLSEFLKKPEKFVIWGAHEQEAPLGLLMVEKGETNSWFFRSLFVSPPFRGFGVGKRLMEAFQTLQPHSLIFRRNEFSRELETLLDRYFAYLGFEPPKPSELYLESQWIMDYDNLFPIIKNRTLPPKCHLSNWSELSTKHLDTIRQKEGPSFPVFNTSSPIVPSVSVCALDEENKVIGWCVGHLKEKENIHYSSVYLDPHWRHTSLSGIATFCLNKQYTQRKKYPFSSTTLSYPFNKGQRIVFGALTPYATRLFFTKKKWNFHSL